METDEKRISHEIIEGWSKFIVLKQESNFKLASEMNRNPVKGIIDEGDPYLLKHKSSLATHEVQEV